LEVYAHLEDKITLGSPLLSTDCKGTEFHYNKNPNGMKTEALFTCNNKDGESRVIKAIMECNDPNEHGCQSNSFTLDQVQ
jgi:hypothetical protein